MLIGRARFKVESGTVSVSEHIRWAVGTIRREHSDVGGMGASKIIALVKQRGTLVKQVLNAAGELRDADINSLKKRNELSARREWKSKRWVLAEV